MEIDLGHGMITNYDPIDFTDIVGSGGFGLVLKSNSSDVVVKSLYKPDSCDSAKIEFTKHREIYNAFKEFTVPTVSKGTLPTERSGIVIPEPIGFSKYGTTLLNRYFSCFYAMRYIQPPMKDLYLVHLILKEEYDSSDIFNKVVGREYSQDISLRNPARGYFITVSKLESILKEFNKRVDYIAYKIGELFGIILFGAEYNPIDVEYVLTSEFKVAALDFGQVEKINFKPDYLFLEQKVEKLNKIYNSIANNIEIDLYVPDFDEKLYIPFIAGVTDSFNLFIEKEQDSEKRLNKLYIFEKLIPQ
jgi:hypothetical protein